jgi:glycosyltransferase involved in cell wall biosynthesis
VLQKTVTLKGRWRHPRGFSEPLAVHFPVDTVQQLRRFSPDVMISVEMGVRTLLAALYRKLHPKSRLIVWVEVADSTERSRGLARRMLRKILSRYVDAFLALGSRAEEYLRQMGAGETKIFRAVYATDLARFSSNVLHRPPRSARRLLYVGRLVELKGLIPFLKVLSGWAASNPEQTVEFSLAGEGPLRVPLERLPVPSNIKLTFLGAFQYDELPAIYAGAGIFVLPTLADTWAVVVNEALAGGLPVLGSVYAQAVEELIQEGRNGWTFHADRPEEIGSAIDRMMKTPLDELDRMRAHARGTALTLTPEHVAGLIDHAVRACVR